MIKGILFDKDGTLIDFFSIWPKLSTKVLDRFCMDNKIGNEAKIKEEIYEKIGITKEGALKEETFGFASYTEVANIIDEILKAYGYTFTIEHIRDSLKTLFKEEIEKKGNCYITFTDNKKMLKTLKEKYALKIGLATADDENAAKKCLQDMDILNYFDYVGGDDGIKKTKPHKDILEEFCKTVSIKETEVVVVGDTKNDMAFAKENNATFIAVLSGVGKKKDFIKKADYILNSVDTLTLLFEKIQGR